MTTSAGIDVDELLALGTATIYEAAQQPYFLPHTLRPVWAGARLVGSALPVSTAPGDNLPLHRALEIAERGEVLVVDGQGAPHGYWGEVLTAAARQRGVLGLVIDGGVRDTDALAAMRFPVFSSSVSIRGTTKADAGTVGEPIAFGRATVRRGDVVVGDADGLVVIPAERIERVLAAARRRAADESVYLNRIRAGDLTLDIYDLRGRGARPST